jgi:hypothetical protein
MRLQLANAPAFCSVICKNFSIMCAPTASLVAAGEAQR